MPDGLITRRSASDFPTTLARLHAVLEAKGVTIFARIDHAAGAASAGMALRPTTLLVFGNPAAGTPLMQAAQTIGVDLPLRALVWQDADGTTFVTYNDPASLAARHGLGEAAGQTVQALSDALSALVGHATSQQ